MKILLPVLALLLLPCSLGLADNYTSRSGKHTAPPAELPAPPEPVPSWEEPEPPVSPTAEVPRAAEVPPAGTISSAVEPTEPVKPAATSDVPVPATPAPVAPAAAAPATRPPAPKVEKVWLDGKLPEGAKPEGEWIWASDPAGGAALAHSHPTAKGPQNHRFTAAEPMEMPGNGMLVQQVWLDPQDPPQGIAMRFKLDSGEEVGVYWEGEKEVFTPNEYEELWYYGMLPEMGKWVSLEVLAEDLGLEDGRIAGITFSTFDGHVLWGKTSITEAPPLEGEGTENPEVSGNKDFNLTS